MQDWLKANQDKVWNEQVATLLTKRFDEPKHLLMLREAASLAKGNSVLDIGCGFAQLSQFLPEGTEYVGVDQSEAMLKRASTKFPDVKLIKGNIYDLEMHKFDTVFAIDFLHHQPDLESAFSRLMSFAEKRLIVSLWIWGRIPKATKEYFGHHGEIIHWRTAKELKEKFFNLNYNVIEKVGAIYRDIYYFDLEDSN